MNVLKGRRIAVDMDEVLYPMLSRLDKHYKARYGKTPPPQAPTKYDYSSHYNLTTLESKRFVESFYHSSIAYETKPIHSAVEAMKFLQQDNELFVVTGRQNYTQCKNVTYQLLDDDFANIFSFVFFTNSYSLEGDETAKSEICIKENFDLLIDDSIHNCAECSKKGIDSYLFGNYSWNCVSEDFTRIESWENNTFT
tara:strand:- start:2495 stop:3082 length:588 start_codon:yes stop_codon:yes gene_type:complete